MNTLLKFWNERKRFWSYFKLVCKHKLLIMTSIFTELPSETITKTKYYPILLRLMWRCLFHDNSKFRPSEFVPYSRCFFNMDGSPKRYEDSHELNYAWNTHMKRNSHHWQYYLRVEMDEKMHIMVMPILDVLEMILDWVAAGKGYAHATEWGKWYSDNAKHIKIHPITRKFIEQFYCCPENILTYPKLNK